MTIEFRTITETVVIGGRTGWRFSRRRYPDLTNSDWGLWTIHRWNDEIQDYDWMASTGPFAELDDAKAWLEGFLAGLDNA